MDEIDLLKLKLPQSIEFGNEQKLLPRHGKGEKFLKGPIPENWLAQAARLPGKAFHVGIVLWFLAGMKGEAVVTLSQKVSGLGVSSVTPATVGLLPWKK